MLPFTRSAWQSRVLRRSFPIINGRVQVIEFLSRRYETTTNRPSEVDSPKVKAESSLFVDSIFPVQLGIWDIRYYIATLREQRILDKLRDIVQGVNVHGFELSSIEPRVKDGGVFINFRYVPLDSSSEPTEPRKLAVGSPDPALIEIKEALLKRINRKGGLPSWLDRINQNGTVWKVRGKPWKEDMRHYASPLLRVSFEGPDVGEERLWEILRPYGRIRTLTPPIPVPAGSLRSAVVTFDRLISATIAHNCIHGAYVPSPSNSDVYTRLKTVYEQPIKPHVIRDWMASHPKIMFPVFIFLLGTLTYTVFDPIRAFVVQAKTMGWLDFRRFAVSKWLPLDRLAIRFEASNGNGKVSPSDLTVLQDRKEATDALNSYLSDYPSTVVFVHGPAGSGKSRLVRSILEQTDRRTVIINCSDVFAGSSDAAMVKSLAEQAGYWPIFSFLNSVNNLIDLASVGLIGQKAGLSSSLQEQVTQVLDVVAQGLRRVSSSRRKQATRRVKRAEIEEKRVSYHAERLERIRQGTWHDGRIDCVAGNGVISELGVGIENFDNKDGEDRKPTDDDDAEKTSTSEFNQIVKREREYISSQDVGALPVVVIKNFSASGKAGKEQISTALADWAAGLVNNNIAHVLVLSDNRENAKRLAKALPTKPLTAVALADADPASSLSYIKQKLKDVSVDYNITSEEMSLIERTGGRASDLDTIIHKVRAGQSVANAMEDIIQRGVAELRKKGFGDDAEDAQGLKWTRQQAWTIVKHLAQNDKLHYYPVLLEFPFKGEESALRAMENAEIISIMTVNGRPSMILPGKPMDRYVFQRLVADVVFQATQDIALNEQLIAGAASGIKSAESELVTLNDIAPKKPSTAVAHRARYLLDKMEGASMKIAKLEDENSRLIKILRDQEEKGEEEQEKRRWWTFG